MSPEYVLAIDPGASGGAVLTRTDGSVLVAQHAYQHIEGALGFIECFGLGARGGLDVVIERVWGSPVMGPAGAFTFGQNYGQWLGLLAASKVPTYCVTPQAWQAPLGVDAAIKGAKRKTALCNLARTAHPGAKITMATCDAVLIGDYAARRIQLGTTVGERLF